MSADIDSFIEDVVKEACVLLQIQDLATNTIATFDARVNICARSAYSQITSYLNKDLAFDSFKEYYYDQDSRITLRNSPVRAVTVVNLIDDMYTGEITDSSLGTALVVTTDYTLRNERDLILNTVVLGLKAPVSIYVEYDGGLYELSEMPRIYEAFLLQTVANYNRLSTLGVAEMNSSGNSVVSSTVGEPLVESARLSLDPFVYYGAAESA